MDAVNASEVASLEGRVRKPRCAAGGRVLMGAEADRQAGLSQRFRLDI